MTAHSRSGRRQRLDALSSPEYPTRPAVKEEREHRTRFARRAASVHPFVSSVPQSLLRASRVAAASELPPPSPAATGIFFLNPIVAPLDTAVKSRSRCAALSTRLSGVASSGRSQSRVMASDFREGQGVVQADGLEYRGDVVVAVVAFAEHFERQVDLGVRPHGNHGNSILLPQERGPTRQNMRHGQTN